MAIIITFFKKNGEGCTLPLGFKDHLECMAAAAGTVHIMAKEASKKSKVDKKTEISTKTAIEVIRHGALKIIEREENNNG